MPKLTDIKKESADAGSPLDKYKKTDIKPNPVVEKEEAVKTPKKVKAEAAETTTLHAIESNANAFVTVEKGFTKNMGDYNSARVTIAVTLPLNPTEAQIKDTHATIKICHDIIDFETEKVMKELEE